jgi:hypothetical protein
VNHNGTRKYLISYVLDYGPVYGIFSQPSNESAGHVCDLYSGRNITESLGNVTVKGEKRLKGQGGSTMVKSLSMYSITENIYYSQLSSVAIFLQPEPNCFTSYNTRK